MKVNLRSDVWWDSFFRWLFTVFIFGLTIATTFLIFGGNWEYLKTFEYWWITSYSTFFALFLRNIWLPKGERVQVANNIEIKEKEDAKSIQIGNVSSKGLNPELEKFIDKEDETNKLNAWKRKCDYKVQKFSTKNWRRAFRKKRLKKWKALQIEVNDYMTGKDSDFNLDLIKVSYYKVNIDDILNIGYKSQDETHNRRYNSKSTLQDSYQTNILTFGGIAFIRGMEVFFTNTSKEDWIVFASQLFIYVINIYSGWRLGSNGIKIKYSYDLTYDINLLKRFLKENE